LNDDQYGTLKAHYPNCSRELEANGDAGNQRRPPVSTHRSLSSSLSIAAQPPSSFIILQSAIPQGFHPS
jgi:hypothetical protein